MGAKRRIHITVCFCTLVLSGLGRAQETYGGGTGDPNDPYLIYTPEQMNAIGAHPEHWDKHFKLMADIDLSAYTGTEFNIIGLDWEHPFGGVFDGGGHTISKFTWNSPGRDCMGLFGCVRGGAVQLKNLGLVDPNIDAGKGRYAGLLVGHLEDGTIIDCYVRGGRISGCEHIGGLVGRNGDGTLISCHFAGNVTGVDYIGGLVGHNRGGRISISYSTGTVTGEGYVGGLVGLNADMLVGLSFSHIKALSGENQGELEDMRCSVVTECYSIATVRGKMCIGGLVGVNARMVTNCYANGRVSGGHYCGGLIGYGYRDDFAQNCYSSGYVTGESGLSGLAGHSSNGMLKSCFWDVETSQWPGGSGTGGKTTIEMRQADTFFAWGVCGNEGVWKIDEGKDYPKLWWEDRPGEPLAGTPLNELIAGSGTMADPFLIYTAEQLNVIGQYPCALDKYLRLMADIDLSDYEDTEFNIIGSDRNSPFSGIFDGNGHVIANFTYSCDEKRRVGLFGKIDGPNARIENLGLVDPNVSVPGGADAGTLVGYLAQGSVENCFAQRGAVVADRLLGGLVGYSGRGTLKNCYSTVAVVGSDHSVGGLLGNNSRGKVINCYSAGAVSGRILTGGLVGWNGGGVSESFWDIETSGQQVSGGGMGRTTGEMFDPITFSLWTACGNGRVWVIDEGNDYPRLWWEGTPGRTIEPVALSDSLIGAGTPGDPFLVDTSHQLNLIGRFPCEWDKHFRLMADLDISQYTGTEFNVIGTYGMPFTGVFDGGGHTISGFRYASYFRDYVGLFGRVSGASAEIRHLGVVDPNIDVWGNFVGVLVGSLDAGTMSNCFVRNARIRSYGSFVGGLVGFVYDGLVINCGVQVHINHSSDYVGGLVGDSDGTIANSYAIGTVNNTGRETGGLVGSNSGTLENCYAIVAVVAADYAGGLVGYDSVGRIERCYAAGPVVGGEHTGGLIGRKWSSGDVHDSFWDVEASGQAGSAGGTGLTTVQMMRAAPFLEAGWDFVEETANGTEEIWWIDEGRDYPRLWWELPEAEPF